jgi:hypothetical protein
VQPIIAMRFPPKNAIPDFVIISPPTA